MNFAKSLQHPSHNAQTCRPQTDKLKIQMLEVTLVFRQQLKLCTYYNKQLSRQQQIQSSYYFTIFRLWEWDDSRRNMSRSSQLKLFEIWICSILYNLPCYYYFIPMQSYTVKNITRQLCNNKDALLTEMQYHIKGV